MESIQTNALNSKYINSLLRPEENPFMQEMQSFEEIMMMYSCAIREVKTKFEVLNDDFSVRYKRNPIEFNRVYGPTSTNAGSGDNLFQKSDYVSNNYGMNADIAYTWNYSPYQSGAGHYALITQA